MSKRLAVAMACFLVVCVLADAAARRSRRAVGRRGANYGSVRHGTVHTRARIQPVPYRQPGRRYRTLPRGYRVVPIGGVTYYYYDGEYFYRYYENGVYVWVAGPAPVY